MQEGNSYTQSEKSNTSNSTLFELKKCSVESTCVSVIVDFSPFQYHNHQNQPSQINQNLSDQNSLPLIKSTPIYNKDNNYFTPSFILESDKVKYEQNKLIYRQLFEQKVQQVDIECQQMYLPKPSKNNSFCCVCKMIFDDYLAHVNLPIHQAFMEKSQFHAEIISICAKFCVTDETQAKKKTAAKRQTKTKTVKKQLKKMTTAKRSKKMIMDSISTSRGHSSNEELIEVVN